VNPLRSVEQTVEWRYAFDIHCNAFFPFFLITSVLNFLLLPALLGKRSIAAIQLCVISHLSTYWVQERRCFPPFWRTASTL
jgi:hypothetical protein